MKDKKKGRRKEKHGAGMGSRWSGVKSNKPTFPIVPGPCTCKNNESSDNAEDVLYMQSTLFLTAHGCSYTVSHRTGFEHSRFMVQ